MVHYVFQVQEENKLCVSKIEKGNYTAGLILDQGTTKEMIMPVLLQVFHYMLFFIFLVESHTTKISIYRETIFVEILIEFCYASLPSTCKVANPFQNRCLSFARWRLPALRTFHRDQSMRPAALRN